MSDPNLSAFIWSVADLLRGDYKQSEYGKVIRPFTVLRRLDCVLDNTKDAVLPWKALREPAGLNAGAHAICKADMRIKRQDIANISFGNTLLADGPHGRF